MKGKKILPVCFLITFVFTSCNLTIPSKFEIKTKANYNFTIAKVNAKLSDYFNLSDVIPSDESSPLKIYDYNPKTGNSEKVQQFMVRMPIQEIPLDFSSYMSSTDLGEALEPISFEKQITVPSVALSSKQTIDSSVFNEVVNSLVQIFGTTQSSVDVTFIGGGFDEAYYKTGKFYVKAPSDTTGYVSLVIVNDAEVPLKTIDRAAFSGGTAILNLDGQAIKGNYTRLLFETDSGKPFEAGIDENSVCSKVTGLNLDPDVDVSRAVSQTISGSSFGADIESVVFGDDCTLAIDYKLPSGWTGVAIKQELNVTGGMNFSKTKTDSVPYSLGDVSFTCSDVDANITVYPEINNATIIFGEDVSLELKIDVHTLKNIAVKIGDVAPDISINQDLPAEATAMINKVVWNAGTGLKITYTNTFPEGNDFTITGVKSSFLGLTEKSEILKAGLTNKIISIGTDSETISVINSGTKIDFAGHIGLPGATPGKIIMKNVVSGGNYKVAFKVEPVLDWKSISINNGSTHTTQQIAIDFNKSSIFEELDNNLGTNLKNSLNLSKMPVHLFCEVPNISEMFTNPHFEGTISAYVANTSEGNLIKDTTKTEITLLNGCMTIGESSKEPVLKFDENNAQITEMKGGLEQDFAPLVNEAGPGQSICVDYDMTFATGSTGDSIEIEKSKIESAGATSMKLVAVIILPLDFTNNSEQQIDLLKMANKDPSEDLFGRTEEPNYNRIKESMEIVEYVKVSFVPEEPFFISNAPITVDVDIDGPGSSYDEQKINIAGGSFQLDDPANLLTIYPLYPTAKITLPAGRFAVPRDAAFVSPIRVSVQTNGDFYLFGGNDD